MGQHVANVEVVTDYTPNESYLRLHMDLPLSNAEADRLRFLLSAERYTAALELVKSANPGLQNVDMLEAAFAEMQSVRDKNQRVQAKSA